MLRRSLGVVLAVAGPVVVWVFAWITGSIGDQPRDGLALANVALVLAGVTVALASVSWVAGLVTSVVAALALNFFHTVPFRSFRIDSGRDVASVALLAVIGLGVSAVTAWRVRRATRFGTSLSVGQSRRQVATLARDPQPIHDVWRAALAATSDDLALLTVARVARPPSDLPVIARREWTEHHAAATVVVPPTGAVLRFRQRGEECLLLAPQNGFGPITVDRRAVLAFADALELALGATPAESPAAATLTTA